MRETSPPRRPLKVLAERFLAVKRDAGLAPRSIETYRHQIEKIIVPKLGALLVGEATPMRLQAFISLIRKEHGPGAAKGCRSVLSGMMALAVVSDAVRVNPVRGVAPIQRGESRAAKDLSLEALVALLRSVASDSEMRRLDLADLFTFMAYVGCRIGEACGLRWSHVDFDRRLITLGPNVVRVTGQGLFIQDHGKTASSVRTVAVPEEVVALLRRRWEQLPANEHGVVFPPPMGKLRDPSNTSADWRVQRERLGFPDFRSHAFRKTVATLLNGQGLSDNEIAEYLGHSDVSVTVNTYMSRTTQTKRPAATLAGLFGEESGSPLQRTPPD